MSGWGWAVEDVTMSSTDDDERLALLLKRGWEPYAVTTSNYGIPTHWLRRDASILDEDD